MEEGAREGGRGVGGVEEKDQGLVLHCVHCVLYILVCVFSSAHLRFYSGCVVMYM